MGKLTGIISKISGSAGNVTFKLRSGETIVSEKVTQVRNPRTNAQMQTRTKWGNIIAGYMIKTIIERIMEIRKGEDDDLSNY